MTLRRGALGVALLAVAVLLAGCRTVLPPTGLSHDALAAAVATLRQPLPDDLASLYSLRTPTSSRLRLSLLSVGPAGRLTVSESFGSALSISAWGGSEGSQFLDLRAGCRVDAADVSSVLRLDFVPLPEVALLLGGRLPAGASDRVTPTDRGRLLIAGTGWACLATVEPDPWRVVRVDQWRGSRAKGWHLTLSDHRGPVPGAARLQLSVARWVELKLLRIQWAPIGQLPPLPDLPRCRRAGA